MRKKSLIFYVISIVATTAVMVLAGSDYGTKYWSPTEEVVTPHIKWAKPDAQGPLKVFFIVSRTGMREVVELAQRMELQYTFFAVDNNQYCENIPGARDKIALTDDIMAKLNGSYDVIVMGNVNWSSFPLIVRYSLLKKVNEGTSLVGFVPNQDDYFKRATAKKEKLEFPALVPYKGLPAFSGYKDMSAWLGATVDCAVFGKGKILTLKGFKVPALQALTPGPIGDLLEPKFVEYDYYLAWISHLMRFAAGRTSVRLTGRDYVFTNRCDLTNVEYFVSGPDGKAVTCVFAFRSDDNKIVSSQERKIKLSYGGTAVSFNIPRAPAGRYFTDVLVKEKGKVWAFGSSFVELSGDPTIESVEIKKDYRWEEKVTGKISVISRKTPVDGIASAKSGMNLVLWQRDTYGRVTAETRLDVPAVQPNVAQEVTFEVSGSQPRTIVQYLELELRKGDEVLDRKEKAFLISNLPPKDDIRVIGWSDGYPSYLCYYMYAELANAGFDTYYGPQEMRFSEMPFLYNIRHIPYATWLVDRNRTGNRTKDEHVRQPCLTDPEYRKELAGVLTKCAEKEKPFSVTEFSLGDENRFVSGSCELCFSSTCVAAFHKFLASEYQTVEAMNSEYGAQYKSFDEVQPVTLDEAMKNPGLQPLWVDFRRHMESTWAGIVTYGTEVIRKIVPEAKVGYEGSDTKINSYQGVDFYKLMKAMRLNNTYDYPFVPYALTSFAQPRTLLGLGWYGGYGTTRCPEFQRYVAWRYLFRGANSYWVFTADPIIGSEIIAFDLSIHDFFKPNVAEVSAVKNGIGKLLMMAKKADDGIAILYSASSVHVSTLTENLPAMNEVLNTLPSLFEDTGHQFRLVSYEQVANGELKQGGYKALWMPYVQALSRKEAGEIEDFVREGGTVIADLRPGVRDEHGKPYESGGILDKVFGVKQVTSVPTTTNCDVRINLEGWSKALKKTACDLSIDLGTGKTHALLAGEKPALIINRYGKGKAILLNFSLTTYAEVVGATVKVGNESGNIRELFNILMAQAGINEMVKIEPEISGVRLYRFEENGLVYLGVLQELPEVPAAYVAGEAKPLIAKSAILKLNEKRHVYDVRQGKYVGYTDLIKTAIEPSKGLLFAFLPYEVKVFKLNAPKRIGQGETLEYETAIDGVERPGLHVFHVELVSPKGENISYYAENIVGENGKGHGSVLLALNEAVGKWKILAKDVATGMIAEHVFVVEEQK